MLRPPGALGREHQLEHDCGDSEKIGSLERGMASEAVAVRSAPDANVVSRLGEVSGPDTAPRGGLVRVSPDTARIADIAASGSCQLRNLAVSRWSRLPAAGGSALLFEAAASFAIRSDGVHSRAVQTTRLQPVDAPRMPAFYWAAWPAIFFSSSCLRASRLKLAPFCMGGKSRNVCANFATSSLTKAKRQNS